MLVQTRSGLRNLAAMMLLACCTAQAESEMETVGLAVYTDTARDIYMAGLLLPAGSDLETVRYSPGPKAMEYRIATRRISSRGFSGTLLLQAELGAGERAPSQVLSALGDLKEAIQGSLLQGDQFIILLSSDNQTRFYLNNAELLTLDDASIFNFLFGGWTGDTSSALVRESLLAGQLNPALLERYENLAPSEERIASIATWSAEADMQIADNTEAGISNTSVDDDNGDNKAAPSKNATPATEVAQADTRKTTPTREVAQAEAVQAEAALPVAMATEKVTETAAAATTVATTAVATAAKVDVIPTQEEQAAKVDVKPKPEEKAPLEVAQAKATAGDAQPPARTEEPVADERLAMLDAVQKKPAEVVPLSAVEAIEISKDWDDREYQLQLNQYVGHVMKKVFGEVRYPRRAVEKQRQGNVELLAYMDEDGQLLDVILDSSSGYGPLDKAAMKAVRNAAPFRELTAVAKEEFMSEDGLSYVMTIPVKFILND